MSTTSPLDLNADAQHDASDTLDSWRAETARLRRALRETEAAQEQTRALNAKLLAKNKQLRELLAQVVATTMSQGRA